MISRQIHLAHQIADHAQPSGYKMMNRYPRNMNGQSRQKTVTWPNNAKIALQFVVNYEEGGENCLLHGDSHSEAFLSEIVGASQSSKNLRISAGNLQNLGKNIEVYRQSIENHENKSPTCMQKSFATPSPCHNLLFNKPPFLERLPY